MIQGIYAKECKSGYKRQLHTDVFAASFATAKLWKKTHMLYN
jgi:hypothetical protein